VITDAEQAGQKCGGVAEPDRSWWQSAFVQTALSVPIFNLFVERLAKITLADLIGVDALPQH